MTTLRRMLRPRSAARRDDRGAAAVEMALLVPVLLLILFGIIDFGRMLNTQIALSQASREGVRGLALGTSANPTTTVQTDAFPVTGVNVAYTSCPANPGPTSVATVTATKSFTYITPISGILNMLGMSSLASPTITGKAQMRCGG
jgi:Flp pilus assembly protein TadG